MYIIRGTEVANSFQTELGTSQTLCANFQASVFLVKAYHIYLLTKPVNMINVDNRKLLIIAMRTVYNTSGKPVLLACRFSH